MSDFTSRQALQRDVDAALGAAAAGDRVLIFGGAPPRLSHPSPYRFPLPLPPTPSPYRFPLLPPMLHSLISLSLYPSPCHPLSSIRKSCIRKSCISTSRFPHKKRFPTSVRLGLE
jgi:hypothetical protein